MCHFVFDEVRVGVGFLECSWLLVYSCRLSLSATELLIDLSHSSPVEKENSD